MSRSLVLFLALMIGGSDAARAQTQPPADGGLAARVRSEGVLSPGDVVRITVWRKPELSGDFLVASDSSIKHPLYKDLKIAGLNLEDAEARVRTFLGRYEASPQVLLEPLLRVTVGGEVRLPNLYTLPAETTIAQAVALGGGPTGDGRLDQVRVVRGREVIKLDLTRTAGGRGEMTVRSGDQIYVGKRRHIFRDFVGPTSSLIAAVAAFVTLARQDQ